MALAYAIVLVTAELFDHQNRDTVRAAQEAADKRFEQLAQESMKSTVVRYPEPRVMTYQEMHEVFPGVSLAGLVGLRFSADIS